MPMVALIVVVLVICRPRQAAGPLEGATALRAIARRTEVLRCRPGRRSTTMMARVWNRNNRS
jgi:hypothetical protein